MFAKIFNFKFNGVAEAKVAASHSDAFGKLIVTNNMRSNISTQMRKPVDPDQVREQR